MGSRHFTEEVLFMPVLEGWMGISKLKLCICLCLSSSLRRVCAEAYSKEQGVKGTERMLVIARVVGNEAKWELKDIHAESRS